jgi:hypothetical protein
VVIGSRGEVVASQGISYARDHDRFLTTCFGIAYQGRIRAERSKAESSGSALRILLELTLSL